MKTKVIIFVIVGIVIVVGLFLYLTRPVKIGVILSTETTLGEEENLAVRYYQNKHSRIGMRPVQYLIENPPLDEEIVRSKFRELEAKGVSVILGGAISRTGMVIAEEAARSGIPTFGITTSSGLLNGKKDNFYRVVTSTDYVGRNLAHYLNRLGKSRVLIFASSENKAYSDTLAESFSGIFAGEKLVIPFPPEEEAFRLISSWKPDTIFSILPETSLIQVIKRAKDINPGIQIVSTEWGFDNLLSMFSGPLLDGTVSFTRRGLVEPEYIRELTAFEEQYNIRSSFASANGFSCLNIIYEAIKAAGSGRKELSRYLDRPRIVKMAYGNIFMDEYGDSINEYHYIQKIEHDALVIVEKVLVEEFPKK